MKPVFDFAGDFGTSGSVDFAAEIAVALLLVDGGLPLAEGDLLSVVDGPFTAPADFEFGFGSCGEGLPAPATLVAIVHLKALVVQ